MIFHASIPADDPERVARVMAEIWRGEAFPFPPWPGGFVAVAGDDRGTTLEVYPRAHTIAPGEGGEGARPLIDPTVGRFGCFHVATATDRSAEDIFAIGRREGWRTVRCRRGGLFEVIELWLENVLMVEVMTADMQADYLAAVTVEGWRERLRHPPGATSGAPGLSGAAASLA